MNGDCRYYISNISLASPDVKRQHTQKSFFLLSLISLLHVSFTGTRFLTRYCSQWLFVAQKEACKPLKRSRIRA
ncbi:Uncharacterised protein [Tatumella ptyseos]|uniref:Uncharacterized protein n=1 Tax=Tatumella ptyseos TaxID=82987 RepID=A0A2X5PEK3_9GAMM|nr:Uncharacterised protein [Tatumella ptyseos]